MAHTLAQVIIPRDTGLAEDVTINTFTFFTGGTIAESDFVEITDRLEAFYTATPTGETGSVASQMSAVNGTNVIVKFYDAALPDVGGPLRITTFTLAGLDTDYLPEEVAITLSFRGNPGAGVPDRRARGRVFVGPLSVIAKDLSAGRVRVKPATQSIIAAAGRDLMLASATGPEWCVFSRGKGTKNRPKNPNPQGTDDWAPFSTRINHVWVDDAFDTIRSRGPAPSGRLGYTAP